MDDLTIALNSLYNKDDNLKNKTHINILEIGTGEGANSTKILYSFFKNINKSFQITSYEGMPELYYRANNIWKNINNVRIVNEYFTKKTDIVDLLIPNLPQYIIDYNETSERFKNKYLKVIDDSNNKYFTTIDFVPDIIFIDSSRFMHLPIINLCYEISNTNPNTHIIMEDDYFVNNNYGELEIIENKFNLKNIIKYKKNTWQWPFVSFNIVSKK